MSKPYPKQILKTAGIKYSRQREQLLKLLQRNDVPITIEQCENMVKEAGYSMNLSTIYRIVDVFVKHNILDRNFSPTQNVTLIELKKHQHRHYLLCIQCHKLFPIEGCPISSMILEIENKSNFNVISHQLEITGYCHQCSDNTTLPLIANN